MISPHPGDETLRAAGHVIRVRAHRDDLLVLVAVTDGWDPTPVVEDGSEPALPPGAEQQEFAWSALTAAEGQVVRLGLRSGSVTADAVAAALRQRVPDLPGPGVEVLVAAHVDDADPDHRAIVQALRELAPRRLHLALAPTAQTGVPDDPSAIRSARPPKGFAAAARAAVASYAGYGDQSTRDELRELVKHGHPSRLTDPRPATRASGAFGSAVPRILVLGHDETTLREFTSHVQDETTPADRGRRDTAWGQLELAAGTARAEDPSGELLSSGWQPLRADPPDGRRALVRALATDLAGVVRPPRQASSADWARTLEQSSRAQLLLSDADVVVSMDGLTDVALAALPAVPDRRCIPSTRGPALLAAMCDLEELGAQLLDADRAETLGSSEESTAQLSEWSSRAAKIATDLAGDGSLLVPMTDLMMQVWAVHSPVRGARILTEVLGVLPWPVTGPGAAARAAIAMQAELTLGHVGPEGLDVHALLRVAGGALAAADEALLHECHEEALDQATAAMAVLFHRALHADVPLSPLIDDPATYLAPLWSSTTFRALTDRDLSSARHAVSAHATTVNPSLTRQPAPRVLVVTGAYGTFHRPVVDALASHADIDVRDFAYRFPPLNGRLMDPQVLRDLVGLVAGQHGESRFGRSGPEAHLRSRIRDIAGRLVWADIVFTDWADRATVWVSHLCPPDKRLIVRIHALDALDPWLHLVRWDRVARVIVVSEPMRSLVTDLLAGLGAQVPVTVLDNLASLPSMDLPKHEGARTTLGMIGWGRKVKDPLWGLNLLEREPGWRLVLIGSAPAADPGPVAAPYFQQVAERLASPALRDRVQIIGEVDDVSEALRGVGVILSCSMRESWHLGLVEGAASGAVPVVRNWPVLAARGGPRSIFPDEWVVDDLDAAEARIRWATDPTRWESVRRQAQAESMALFDPDRVAARYRALILGAADAAPDVENG